MKIDENWLDEIWCYAGLRDAGNNAEWIPILRHSPSGEEADSTLFECGGYEFKASKRTKANAVPSR